jgi:predicted amidohydrolase YtcJ
MAPLGSLLRAGGLAAALLPFNSLAAPNPPVVADLVFRNGSIYTLNERGSKASALAVKDGVISHVGTDRCVESHIGEKTRIVDLQGHMVMPGLIDSHMHILSGGLFLLKCDLAYQSLPLEAILEHVQGCIDDEAQAGDDTWLEVVNMDYPGLVERSGPVGKLQLDRLSTKRPVMIRSSDYHTVLANSRALDLSNINSETEDPANGKIERLPGSREPSGVLQDDAWGLLAGPPPPSEEDNLNAGRAALKLLREAGITTFQEAAAGEEHHAIFDAIRKEGGLSARGYFDYRIEAPKSVDEVEDLVSHVVGTLKGLHDDSSKLGPEPTLKWQAIKAFIDGVITYPSSTAALIEPYWLPKTDAVTNQTTWSPDPTTLKDPYWQPEVLTKTLELLFLSKIDAQLHTDGDLSVRIALDAAESFRNKYPKKDFRLGLAHDELSHQDDWARFAELGVDAIMSFQWAQLSSFYIPSTFLSLAEYRHGNLQSYAKIEEAGRPVVYGSDWPVSFPSSFLPYLFTFVRRLMFVLRLTLLMSSWPCELVLLVRATLRTPTHQLPKVLHLMVFSQGLEFLVRPPSRLSQLTALAFFVQIKTSAH